MLSYLDIVKKLVEPEIYNRGVRLYLEGKVLSFKELTLDYWRRYEVQGKTDTYIVDIPLLHLALDKNKHNRADIAMAESVRSTSPYFQEFGVDAQCVAVCAALDQEYKIAKNTSSAKTKQIAEGVWDKILEAESSKKEREWSAALEKVIYSGFGEHTKQYRELKEMLSAVIDSPKVEFPVGMENIFEAVVGDYLLEKNLLKLFTNSFFLSKGGLKWWSLISPFIPLMDVDNQSKLVIELWKNHLADNTKDFEVELSQFLQKLSQEIKNSVLEQLKIDFEKEPELWIRFALDSRNTEWLQANLDHLDGRYLVSAAQHFPDWREEIEQKLVRQIRVWSDFLQSGEYEELLNLLKLWKDGLGRSDYFEEVLTYIRQNHPKKTKLIRGIEKIN